MLSMTRSRQSLSYVTSEYEWQPGDHPPGYPHVRRVDWKDTVSRDEFTTSTKNTLGSTLTVFSLAGDAIQACKPLRKT